MRRLTFDTASFTRSSPAWCPVTGKAARQNEPRIVDNFILQPNKELQIYHRFEASQGFTAYNSDPGCYHRDGETTDYLSDWLTVIEECHPSLEKILLGSSYEGRDIWAFRLGPTDRQHFVIDCVVHGNETDGLAGNLKAMVLLLTHPDFAPLRDAFTLFFIPCCNPDGFYVGTRNLTKLGPHPSGVPTTINLNRVWPWFWDEFTPSDGESKGEVPMDTPEAQALYLWRTTGNDGDPTPIRFLMDQHSTAGDGARYQSRDRNFKQINEGAWFDCWFEYLLFQQQKATQAKRVWEEDMPDLWINYYRSRYVPHWHTWNANVEKENNGGINPLVVINEYNKVASVLVDVDPETYQSACNYTLDYTLNCAVVMQSDYYQPRTAVLIENPNGVTVTNEVTNSEFNDWQEKDTPGDADIYRPRYWNKSLSGLLSSGNTGRHIDYQGRPMRLEPQLKIEVPVNTLVGPTDYHDVQTSITTPSQIFIASVIDPTSGFDGFHVSYVEMGGDLGQVDIADFYLMASAPTTQFRFIDIDTSAGALAGNFRGVYLSDGSYMDVVEFEYDISTALYILDHLIVSPPGPIRNNAATAFRPSDLTLYIIGGEPTPGSYTQTVLAAKKTGVGTGSVTEKGTNLLTTADSGGEAVYCSGGDLDDYIVMIGGKATHTSNLRVVIIDVDAPTATEYLVDVSGTTLPYKLISCGLHYDGNDTIWIYGGEDPSTGAVHLGVWTLRWTGSDWEANDERLLADAGDAGDPVDYGGTSYWARKWSRWRAVDSYDAVTGENFVLLVGGVEEDITTGLPLPGPYTETFLHSLVDDTLTRPEEQNYAYARYNAHLHPLVVPFDKVAVSWSFKADPTTASGYVRITNSPGDSTTGTLTTRRCRTYYMHPPRDWWWRDHGVIDLTAGDPTETENELRLYARVYQDAQTVSLDAPMVVLNTLWPFSWLPEHITLAIEIMQWSDSFDPRWFRLSIAFLPQAVFTCLTADLEILRIESKSPATSYLSLTLIAGDLHERTYVRDQSHSMHDPVIRLTVYDSARGTQTSDLILYWGGSAKDIARGRFDTPVTIELWQHAVYGCGLIINNFGMRGKVYIPGILQKSLWTAPATLKYIGGGWWSEPDLYELTDYWVMSYAVKNEPTGALLIGERDPTFGQVSQRSCFKYTEDFHRVDDVNLGDYWDVIQQTGDGWGIYSNQARCCEVGWERWDAYPYIRDVAILGDVKIGYVGGRVGFFTRIHWGTAVKSSGTSIAHGYLGTLHSISAGNTVLEIERVYYNAGAQGRTSLATAACTYTINDVIELEFEAVGSTLTLIARSGETVIATCTVVDTNHVMPGAFGICGETTSGSRYVYLSSVWAEPRGTNKIRITD
jgi:hypothetical protein